MRDDLIHCGGFGSPLPYRRRRHQRTTLSLVACLGLAIGTAVAVTAVTIGIAQAEILAAARSGGGNLAAAAFLAAGVAMGGIAGAVYRRRQQRND